MEYWCVVIVLSSLFVYQGGPLVEYTVGAVINLVWFPTFFLITTLALNRYVVICKGKALNEKIFCGRKAYYWMLACVIAGSINALQRALE